MNKKLTFLTATLLLLIYFTPPVSVMGQTRTDTYEQLTSIANIDESAQYVLGIDETGFHYEGTSSWGKTALPSAQTPIYYTLTKASDGNSFTAKATISGTTYYLQIPTSNTFSMATSTGTNTDIIIGTTQVSGTNYAVANKTSTTRHLRINGTSGLRSYAGATGTMAFFYKVTSSGPTTYTVTYNGNGNTSGSAPVDSDSPYDSGATVTVLGNTGSLAKTHYAFGGWNTAADGSGTNYAADDEFTISANTTLYAKWIANTHDITMPSSDTYGSYTASATSSVAYGTTVTLTYTPATGYESYVATWSINGTPILGNTFEMPDNDVTVTVTVTPAPEWRLVDLANLTSSDIFVIVGTKSSTSYAMTNDGAASSAPSAPTVTIADNKITSTVADNMKWNISGNATDGYTFYPNGSTTTWLYCTNTNDGVRVGTNASKTFTVNYGYLKHDGTSRYVGVYTTNPDWRCYTSYTTDNIKDETFTFYKRVVPSTVATPTLSVASGTYGANQSVSITCLTDGAAIYYTTDGTEPTSSSTAYSGAISITQNTTLKAVAYKSGEYSEMATATYTLLCANPSLSVAEGTYNTNQSVTITCATDGATIYYTTNGDTPTSSSTAYSSAISITQNTTLKAIAIKSGWNSSDVVSATYTLKCATPSFSPADGAYTTAQNVSISSATADVAIYYTLDGTTPTSSSAAYSSAITIDATTTLKAIATKSNWEDSDVATAEYLIASAQNLTVVATHHASLTVKANGAVIDAVEGVYPIPYGATVTLEGEEESGYGLNAWTSDQVTVSANVFPMPNEDVTVTASYDEVWYATFMVNGSLLETKNVVKGNAIGTLPTPESGIPAGFAFKGWYNGDYAISDTPPTYITTAFVPESNVTLNAVLAVEEIVAGEETNLDITISNFNEITTSYTTVYTHNYTSPAVTVEAYGVYNNSNGIQMNSGKGTYIKNTTAMPGYITKFVLTWTASGKNSPTMYANANSVASTSSDNLGKQSNTVTEQTINIADPSGKDYKYFYFDGTTVTAACYLSSFKIYYRPLTITYSNYSTAVTVLSGNVSGTYTGACAVDQSVGATIKTGTTLTASVLANTDATKLTIEDGGQLVTSSAVSATVKKSIAAWTTDPVGGWYFIASPVNAALNPTAAGLITDNDNSNPTYDFYYLNGSENKWKNYRNATFSMSNGAGYLYANQSAQTLSFSGEIKPYSTSANTVTLANTGWNLIGNPFTCEVSVSTAFSELNNGTAVTNKDAGSRIMPCAGIAVYGNADDVVTFTKAEAVSSVAPGQGGLNIAVVEQTANTRGVSAATDNVIVSFNEGSTLPKFNLLEGSAKLYIPQGNEEYAIAYSEGQGEMPVNFKAANNGTYTLTVNPEGVEMAYLHLIDNMTGTEVDLLAEPSYTFEARTTDYESRFRLVFASSASEDANGDNAPFAFVSNGEIVVNGTGTLQVVDVLGRILRTQETSTANSQLSTANFKPGVYVLRIISGNDVRTQKIVVR